MKKKKPFLNMDERTKLTAYKVIAVMYFLTIISIQGIVIYRQLALGQSVEDFEDLAVVMTVNSIFLVSALLYFGGLPFEKFSIKSILLIYLAIVVLGSLFTYAKYNVFQDVGLSFKELIDKLLIVYAVSGLLMLFFILFSYLGKKRMEKELE